MKAVLPAFAVTVLSILTSGCQHPINTRYVPSIAPAPQPIRGMQVGTFLGEELFELSPNIFAESGKSDFHFFSMPASEFIHNAFLAELHARGIDVDTKAKRVAGELLRFEFPCEDVAAKPPTVRCSMRFRFAIRDHARVVFEKTYAPFVTLKRPKGQSTGEHAGQAFVQLLARVFSAFLEDPAVVAVFAAPSVPSPTEGPDSDAEITRAEGRGLQRKLKDNRIYTEIAGRSLLGLGLYYDRKVLEYGYMGLGMILFPGADSDGPCKPDDPCGSGGIWATPFVGVNSPNLMRWRLFAELGLQKELAGVAWPRGLSVNYSMGIAFQAPGGFDLQIGCTRIVHEDLDILCIPRLDLGGAF